MCTLFNDAANGSSALRADEVRDRESPNCESQYLSQGLVVACRSPPKCGYYLQH